MVVDNVAILAALPLFLITTDLGLALSSSLGPTKRSWLVGSAAVLLLSALLVSALVLWRPSRLPLWIRRSFGHARCDRIEQSLARTAIAIQETLVERPYDVAAAVFFHYLGKLWILAELALLTYVLGCASVGTVTALGL
jgi:hypothetical protein